MTLKQRIELLVLLGKYLLKDTSEKELAILHTEQHNRWLTKENSKQALESIATQFLTLETLETLAQKYDLPNENKNPKKIGLILAGNIPAVGFHDVLATFLSGNIAVIKYSSKDNYLIPFMVAYLEELEPKTKEYFISVDRLSGFDAIIATGSDNSAIYFEQYFGKYPNIIRKNRNSIAVLTGQESEEELIALGKDIFDYYGLGCRSVSKLYLPKGYDLPNLMRVLDHYKDIMHHDKYRNNFDYNRSIFLLNQVPHLINDCIMVLENESLLSRIATLHYEYYQNEEDLKNKLDKNKKAIQCVATGSNLDFEPIVGLGQTQCPTIEDYADGVDTLQFLISLK